MAKLHSCRLVVASILVAFLLPTTCLLQARKLPSSRSLSFELHLQRPPLNLYNISCMQQPLTPFRLSDQPIFHFDETSLAHINVGVARGLYLADPAAFMELRYIFFTATLQKDQEGHIAAEAAKDNEEGSLVLMGSIGSGAISVVGGTRGFAFASGQAKVSMAPAGSSEQLIIVFDVELQYLEEDTALL